MGARGTTDYSHQQHICETTTVSMQDPLLSILNVIVPSYHQIFAEYISVELQVNSRHTEGFYVCNKYKMLRLFFTKTKYVQTETALSISYRYQTHTHTCKCMHKSITYRYCLNLSLWHWFDIVQAIKRKTSTNVEGKSIYVDSIHGQSFHNIDQHSLSNRKIINNYSCRREG